MKITVGVFFGGCSVEHEVSVISGLQAFAAIDREKYMPVPVYQAKDGCFYTGTELSEIAAYRDINALLKKADRVQLVREDNKVWLKKVSAFGKKLFSLDVAMPVFHGTYGEDGCFQGMMEQLKLPYVGCSVLASALGMDKYMMKAAFMQAGVACLEGVKITKHQYFSSPEEQAERVEQAFSYPVIVKPCNLGSSVGIGKAKDRDSLRLKLEEAFMYTDNVLCERCIEQLQEINCSVIGDSEQALASVCEQPLGGEDFLSYADKYQSQKGSAKGAKSGGSKSGDSGMASLSRLVPAPIGDELTQKVQKTAVDAFLAIGGEGIARIDLMIDKQTNNLFVNEINTLPGSLSFYLWEASGVSFTELLSRLISLAFKRQRRREALTLSFDSNLLQTAGATGTKGAKGTKGK